MGPEDDMMKALAGIRRDAGAARVDPAKGKAFTISIGIHPPEADPAVRDEPHVEQLMGDEHAVEDMGIPGGVEPIDLHQDEAENGYGTALDSDPELPGRMRRRY